MKGYLLIPRNDQWFQRRLQSLHLRITEEIPDGREKDLTTEVIAKCMATADAPDGVAALTFCTDQLMACHLTLAQQQTSTSAQIASLIQETFLATGQVIHA